MKKITSFVVLLAALLLTLPAQAFTWNWAEHETLSFLDMKKVTSRFVPINEATPVQMDAMEAPQSMLPVAGKQLTRRAAIASVDALVGTYTWDYKTASEYNQDPTQAESTDGSSHVTIAKGTEENSIVISGLMPSDLTATVDITTGAISLPRQTAGTSSYGDYDIVGLFYYAGDDTYEAGWYTNSYIPAVVGEDGVITFNASMWIERILTTGSYTGYSLTPYWLPGSTLTPSEPLTPVTPSEPAIASAEEFSMTYYSSSTDTEAKSASVKVAVDGNDVYIQGFSSYLPEAWVKGTKDGNTVTFPKMQYMGEYAGYTSFFFYGGDAVFTYDSETSTYSATGQIFGVLGEQYYDGSYFNPVLTKVVEVAGTPATPSINSLINSSNYGWYFTFNIPLQDTNGNNMVASKVTYKIYTDVNHEVSLLTFTPTTHTKLTQDMSEFPYGFTDNWDFTATSIYLNDLFSTTWHQIGIQTIYTGGGETHESEIGWYKIKEYPVAKDVDVSPESGTDISAAISAALGTEGDWAKNVTITLAEGGNYTITESIVPAASVTINGNGATIDAKDLTAPFIVLNGSTTLEKKSDATESTYYRYEDVKLNNVIISGLKQSLAQSGQKSMIKNFIIDGSIINMEANKVVFDFNTNPAYAETWTIQNSTLWSAAGNTKYLIQTNAKCPDIDADHKCVITLENNTFYQIAKGSQLNNGNQFKGKPYVEFNINKNIFVYTGNAGSNTIKGLCFGQASEGMIKTFGGNTFWADADESANWGKMGTDEVAIKTDPYFKDAANGDFAIASNSAQAKAEGGQTGDARWGTYDAGFAIKAVNTEGITITPEVAYAAVGEKVYATYTLSDGYQLDKPEFVDDNGDAIPFAEGQVGLEKVGDVEKMFIIMPATNVTIKAKASKVYQITLDLSQENGNATCLSVNKEKPETAFKKEGDKIYLAINPDAGYEAVISVKAGEDDVKVTAEAGTYDEQQYTHFFTMPASAVTVTVTFKNATGINSIAADKMKDATIYTIGGQRVNSAKKGLYIINGKKVVIK